MFGFLEFCFRDAVVHNSRADANIRRVVFNLQASYRDATVELAVNGQIHHRAAVVAAFGFFELPDNFHRLNFRRTGQRPHIHRRKICA